MLFGNEDGLSIHAYRLAWTKCLDRLQVGGPFLNLKNFTDPYQEVIRALHVPVANAVIEEIYTSHSDLLPGLPRLELRTITISGLSTRAMVYRLSIRFKIQRPARPFSMKLVVKSRTPMGMSFSQKEAVIQPT